MSTTFKHFESPEEYAAYLRAIPSRFHHNGNYSFSGETLEQGCTTLEQGDTSRLAEAQAILDKLDLAHLFSNNIPVLEPCVAGFIPNVPAAIAGHPQSMFQRGFIESPSILAPLTVYVETAVSAGVTQQQLIARGVATLAFVLAMELVRPVDLYAVSLWSHDHNNGIHGSIVKIASRPMDLGRAVWMLTAPTYARRLAFSAVNFGAGADASRLCSKPWIFDSDPTHKNYLPKIRELLALQPEDVFMKGGYLFDKLMLTDPVAWVTKMIAEHSGKQHD